MADTYVLAIEGLAQLGFLDETARNVIVAAKRAVNDATRYALRQSSREIRRQVNFPAHYLSGTGGRLSITKFATDNELEGRVGGERRATSLSRFVRGRVSTGGGSRAPGVTVEVKPGSAVRLRRAFLIKLRKGSGKTDTQFNMGVAIRTKEGQRPTSAYKPKPIGKNLWLLYGPSVDSAFLNLGARGGVARQLTPDILKYMEQEFTRQMEVLK